MDESGRVFGPTGYRNWHEMLTGAEATEKYEVWLYSDTHVVGEVREGAGPYRLLNAIAPEPSRTTGAPTLVLRTSIHLHDESAPVDSTDTSVYHGGSLDDEIAALWSLLLGARFKPGGITRRFSEGLEPEGSPWAEWPENIPSPVRKGRRVVLERCLEQKSLEDGYDLFLSYPQLSSRQAIALVRASRLYQDAIWIAESQANLAWIMLVSALETAALEWSTADDLPVELLRAGAPRVVEILEASRIEELQQIADLLGHLFRAQGKFVAFIKEFLPPAPPLRPPEWAQVRWSKTNLTKALRKVYEYRSLALHSGVPFPGPMCEAPWLQQPDWDAPAEKLGALGASVHSGSWLDEDIPMHLNTFEYIVRQALLAWWRDMEAVAGRMT